MSSSQATVATQAETERAPDAQQTGKVAASAESMLAEEVEASSSSSSSSSKPARAARPPAWQVAWQKQKTKRQICE